jgi:hypothetical protein
MTRFIWGTICLLIATLCFLSAFGMIIAAARVQTRSAVLLLSVAFGILFLLMTLILWYRSVKLCPGDDIFSDQRGLLVALMVITILVVGGGTTWLAANPDFWAGMLRGVIEAEREP